MCVHAHTCVCIYKHLCDGKIDKDNSGVVEVFFESTETLFSPLLIILLSQQTMVVARNQELG